MSAIRIDNIWNRTNDSNALRLTVNGRPKTICGVTKAGALLCLLIVVIVTALLAPTNGLIMVAYAAAVPCFYSGHDPSDGNRLPWWYALAVVVILALLTYCVVLVTALILVIAGGI